MRTKRQINKLLTTAPWPEEKPVEITREQAEAAVALLDQYGRQAYHDKNAVDPGQALGMAIWKVKGHAGDVLSLAAEACEQENSHIYCAILTAIKHGKVKRNGCSVKIVLPEMYATF